MDVSKAFDCIPHDLLIAKLRANGFNKKAFNLKVCKKPSFTHT